MNYDKAYDLAAAMRESEEYKELMAAQAEVEKDEVSAQLVRTFMAQQMEWEYAKLAQAPNEAELLKKQEALMPEIEANPLVSKYVQAHMRWSQVSNDIYKIISGPITEGMKVLEHESKDKQH